YHTVYVPIFKNYTFRRGLEFDLTREVCKQIEQKTPYKVVGSCDGADTELVGTITMANKNVITRNQLNEIREGETLLAVELVWRDLKTGEILSQPRRGPGAPPINLQIPGQPVLDIPSLAAAAPQPFDVADPSQAPVAGPP